jgi:hypothetical protein
MHLSQKLQYALQAPSQGMQAAVEAGGAQGFGEVAHTATAHDAQGSFMVVLEVHGSHHAYQQHLGIGDLSETVATVVGKAHGILDEAKSHYNECIVQGVAPPDGVGLEPPLYGTTPWTFN